MSVKSFIATTLVPTLLFVAAASCTSPAPQQCEWVSGIKSGLEFEACLTYPQLEDYLSN